MNTSTRNNLLMLLLVTVTLAVYLPVRHHGFIDYDDMPYVAGNPQVTAGLTWEGVRWAFTTGHAANWHPVTWLSHMTDCQLFGVKPGAHHLVNVGFHLLNVALLFWVLRLMTGAVWRSLVVAGLFALHPLHVESVAWIAERKDLLSTFFGLLTLWAYTCYVRRPGVSRYALALLFFTLGLMSKPMLVTWPFVLLLLDWWPLGRWGRGEGDGKWLMVDGDRRIQKSESRSQKSEVRRGYSASSWDGHLARPERCAGCHKATGGTPVPRLAGIFSAGGGTGHRISSRSSRLRVKPSSGAGVHATPSVADQGGPSPRKEQERDGGVPAPSASLSAGAGVPSPRWLLLEKLPFFLLAVGSSVVTFFVQHSGGAVITVSQWPLWLRVGNTPLAYGAYLWKMVWPVNLAVLYPVRPLLPLGLIVGSAVMLFIVTALVVWRARRQPYLATGWFWYVGTLVPVIGLVQVGEARMADRYTYIPLIGIFVLLVWAVAEWTGRWRWGRAVAGIVAVAVLAACGAATARQVRVWQTTVTLFEHARSVGEASVAAHTIIGNSLLRQGRSAAAIVQYREALRFNPDFVNARNNLGLALLEQHQPAEAMAQFREVLRLRPDFAQTHHVLGLALTDLGQSAEAMAQFREALRLEPDFAEAHYKLGDLLRQQGQSGEAIRHYREALRLKPANAEGHNNLGISLASQGQSAEAITHFREALRLEPEGADARNNLGVALAAQGHYAEALAQHREVLRRQPDQVQAFNSLAWVLATAPEAGLRDGAGAVRAAERACELTGHKDAGLLDTLAAAFAEAGRLDEAVKVAEKALTLAGTDKALTGQIESHLKRYRQGQPWREN